MLRQFASAMEAIEKEQLFLLPPNQTWFHLNEESEDADILNICPGLEGIQSGYPSSGQGSGVFIIGSSGLGIETY